MMQSQYWHMFHNILKSVYFTLTNKVFWCKLEECKSVSLHFLKVWPIFKCKKGTLTF